LSHELLIEKFKDARCYLGMSRSDGISTSFLEALTYGSYPIQTDTSCAAEWISLGAIGAVINSSDISFIARKIQDVFLNDELVDFAQSTNNEIARKYLSFEYIKSIAKSFYEH
jgi:glycosyltransferase involved in cell wall biosynthesis